MHVTLQPTVCVFMQRVFLQSQQKSTKKTAVSVWTGHLWAGPGAVHDGVAAIDRERILQLGQTFLRELVPRVDHPTIRLKYADMRYSSTRSCSDLKKKKKLCWGCLEVPAWAQPAQDICLRSTSSLDSWYCNRRTEYTRTGRPARGTKHRMFIVSIYLQT